MIGARSTAHSNIALVKYWGKRSGVDPNLNLPAVGSLSMTLDSLRTQTTVVPSDEDSFVLDGESIDENFSVKVFRHLDRIWNATGQSGVRPPAAVGSVNHLPTAAGLASSASGFAALTLAGARAYELDWTDRQISSLARQGSGSAARSIWGGFVRLEKGERPDGLDCQAVPLFPQSHWDLRLLVVHTARGPKEIGSTEGMERSRTTSPYYDAWVESSPRDLEEGERALEERNFEELGRIMERSCFKMHACMFASDPPLVYWNATTLAVIKAVTDARRDGLAGYVTSDAGPFVKVLTKPETSEELAEALAQIDGVHKVTSLEPGPDATTISL